MWGEEHEGEEQRGEEHGGGAQLVELSYDADVSWSPSALLPLTVECSGETGGRHVLILFVEESFARLFRALCAGSSSVGLVWCVRQGSPEKQNQWNAQ